MKDSVSPASAWAPTVLVGGLPLGFFLLWGAADGGYPATVWYPGALALVALVALLVGLTPQLVRTLSWPALVALASFTAFTVWTGLSIVWATDKGEAWDAANRTLLYLAAYAVFLLWPWRPRQVALLLGAYSLGIAGIAAGSFVSVLRSEDPGSFFIEGRYIEPVGYVNADCALFLSAFWPAVFLASRRETPWWLRGLFLAAAGFLLEQAVLPQSRGSLFVFPVVVALYLALVPGRTRSLLALGPACAAAVVLRDPLLDVYTAAQADAAASGLAALEEPLLGSAIALFAVGTAYGLVDRFAPLRSDLARLGTWILWIATGLAAAVTAIALVVAFGNPATRARDAWDEFTAGSRSEQSAYHLGSNLGSDRYDFWRVAMGEFRDSPVTGIGAGNFAAAYLRERRSNEEPLYPHSLPVMVLSQTGGVGGGLFVAFLASALLTVWRGRRWRSRWGSAAAAAAVVTFTYFVLHGSLDWFWEFPALGAPALAWLGLAGSLERPATVAKEAEAPQAEPETGPRGEPRREPPRRWSPLRVLAAGGSTLCLVAVAASLTLPWLAAREIDHAASAWRTDSEHAYVLLGRARRLNALSARADLVAGAIAMRREEYERARDAFARALERDDENWYAELELGIVAALDDQRNEALARLERAEALNPREETVDLVRKSVVNGKPFDPRIVDRILLQRVEARTS
jgi:tetratricopeptide (TPR) repeat protein